MERPDLEALCRLRPDDGQCGSNSRPDSHYYCQLADHSATMPFEAFQNVNRGQVTGPRRRYGQTGWL